MTAPDLPVLTFPKEVADFVRENYERANVILEYGSGGSTFLAAGQEGKTIVSVESDPRWAMRMREIAAAHSLPSTPTIIYHDIGPVGNWARAVDLLWLSHFYGYAQDVWDSWAHGHPEIILIDGRFRAACFMAAYLSATRRVRVLFDDYDRRKQYHVIERLGKPVQRVGRMAVFDIDPEQRSHVEPWLLVSTFFEAVCSFTVGPAPPKKRIKDRLRAALRFGSSPLGGDTDVAAKMIKRRRPRTRSTAQ